MSLECLPMDVSDDDTPDCSDYRQPTASVVSCDDALRAIIVRRSLRRNDPLQNAALLRLAKDALELRPQRGVVVVPHVDPWSRLVHLRPSEGFYSAALLGDEGLQYSFRVKVGVEYPFDPPSVTCVSPSPPLYHPNVDAVTGRVCMELLTRDWTPIMSLGGVLDSLLGLLEEPVCVGPTVLNAEAAYSYRCAPQALVAALQGQQQQRAIDARVQFYRQHGSCKRETRPRAAKRGDGESDVEPLDRPEDSRSPKRRLPDSGAT